MPPRDFSAATYLGVYSALSAAVKTKFTTTATALGKVHTDVLKVPDDTRAAATVAFATWTGPAASGFDMILGEVEKFTRTSIGYIENYKGELEKADTALGKAQTDMNDLAAAFPGALTESQVKDRDERARTIIGTLAFAYDDVRGNLHVIPTSPEKLAAILRGGGREETDDDEDEEEKDEKEKEKEKDEKEKEKEKEEEAGGGGGEDKKDEGAGGSGGGDSGGGSGDKGGGGTGGGDSAPPPVLGNGKLTDTNRGLADAPRVKGKNGKYGYDVDGDGQPDLDLSGKPLKDAKLVELDGLRGVDVDGDGKPDIGVHGEILKHAPIVQGPDGVIGIDLNGDGKPDLGISGQVLPDAPIVTKDGITGVDVNGDGKPDIGFDRKPLPDAELITVDGLTGVDVNGDGKPDIGINGEILKFAPMVTTPLGISGIDVNADGKPDIASLGGQTGPLPQDRDPLAGLEPPIVPGPPPVTNSTSLTSLHLGGNNVVQVPDFENPPTVLTGLGASTGVGRAVMPGGADPGTHQPSGGMPIGGHSMATGATPVTAGHRPKQRLAGEADLWQDNRGVHSVLGRPSYDDDEWEG